MSRPKYFIKTEVMVYGGRTKYYVVKGFSDEDEIAKVGSERDATRLCEEFERLTDENARLKAEVERLNGIILAQSSDFVRSKTADDGIKPEGHNDLAGRAVERCLELQAENERLAGEVNRLYLKTELLVECGDEMANRAGQEWCPTWVVEDWNKAKEGKQS